MTEFIPFSRHSLGDEEIASVARVLRSDWLTMGPRTEEFEKRFAEYVGCEYAVAVSSCTAALHLALEALHLKPGDEIIVPSFTFAATANSVVHAGALPIFADISADTYCLDPQDVLEKISSRTRGVILVHYGGRPGPGDELCRIAEQHGFVLIEDAAHALPAKHGGKMVGAIGKVAGFSFYATKNLATGDGGMLTTNDAEIAEGARLLRLHGLSKDAWRRYSEDASWRYEIIAPGFKYNMTDLQAAIGLCQLKKLNALQKTREDIAAHYLDELADLPGLILPSAGLASGDKHAWHLFPVRIEAEIAGLTRDQFVEQMHQAGIGTSVHFLPLHLQPYYRKTYGGKEGQLPVTESVAEEVVSLPIYPRMTSLELDTVAETVRKIITQSNNEARK